MQLLFQLWSTIGLQHNALDTRNVEFEGLSLSDLLVYFYFAQTNF